MSSKQQKLRLIGAFAALATLALAISCHGFFVNPTLTSIVIAPSAPQVEIGNQVSLTVYGTYNDGSTGPVGSGVTWSSSDSTVASFTSPTSNVLKGIALGTATITANAQAVTATATATVYLGGISQITVNPTINTYSITAAVPATYTAKATANGTTVDITTQGAVWTLSPSNSAVICQSNGTQESCTATSSSGIGTYSLVVSYPGTAVTATATLNVTN